MKKLYTLLFVALTGISFGQVALYEDFNYTVPGFVGGNTNTTDATGSNNWSTHSNSQIGTIDVISGNLTYPGLANSNGNKILLPGNNTTVPRDINRGFTTTATTIYYSFLLNIVDNTQLTATISGTNNYFISLGGTTGTSVSSLFGRVAATTTNSGANFRLSISNTSTGTLTYTENPVDLNFGTTYLVVVKYDRSAAPTVATMWVNPSNLGGTEPTSTITNNSGTAAVTAFASVAIRNASATPKAEIDEIRVGETWASVTPEAPASTNSNSISGLTMYPNPLKGNTLFITSTANAEMNVKIYNVLGKEVLSTKVNNTSVDVSNLASGVYIVKVTEEGKTATRKLVIQ
ncbi:T9SS type A sorting domain-containing protein [Flavobacterium sasangense]|uniref:T9SS type A sorting domain-containing protein n=1 Tax=Flavobacterium sasangense TaxID=503361 RepID=UPI00068BB220|nr:T9SS type A sorting domain-containing protein [Flavobacterium sasangense]